jgi:3-oxoacyl-[acyl-carrier-protein] synthase II
MNVALATVALGHGSLFPPCDSTGLERAMSGNLSQVLVTSVGHWRGEGLALVERVG